MLNSGKRSQGERDLKSEIQFNHNEDILTTDKRHSKTRYPSFPRSKATTLIMVMMLTRKGQSFKKNLYGEVNIFYWEILILVFHYFHSFILYFIVKKIFTWFLLFRYILFQGHILIILHAYGPEFSSFNKISFSPLNKTLAFEDGSNLRKQEREETAQSYATRHKYRIFFSLNI
jgi:hypothetical protein